MLKWSVLRMSDLIATGPSDPRWPEVLARYPELAPARSRFDQFVLECRRAGLLPIKRGYFSHLRTNPWVPWRANHAVRANA